jgi:hypothetical protein
MSSSIAPVTPIRLVYAVGDAEQRAAIRELVAGEPQVRWFRIGAALLPIVMVTWSMSVGWSLGMALFRNVFWIVLAVLALTVYLPWTVRSIVRAIRRADPEWDREQAVTIGEQGIRLESAAETTEIPWTAVRRAVERPTIVLIYIGAARVLYLPSRIVSAQADLRELRRVLREKLDDRASLAGEDS